MKYNPYIRNHKSLLGNVCIVLLLLWYKKARRVRNISKRYCHDDASWRVWVLVFCSRYNTILKCEWRMGKSEKNNISSDQVATQVTFIKDTTKKTMTTDLLGPNHMQHQRQVVVVGKALYMAPPWSDFSSAIHRKSMKTKQLWSCNKNYLALINGLLVY